MRYFGVATAATLLAVIITCDGLPVASSKRNGRLLKGGLMGMNGLGSTHSLPRLDLNKMFQMRPLVSFNIPLSNNMPHMHPMMMTMNTPSRPPVVTYNGKVTTGLATKGDLMQGIGLLTSSFMRPAQPMAMSD